ncbi:glycoside hydrolase family 78 protein [Streptomyces sp. NBC_00006]|uniref:alpha-L-rhamnosidase n=1 Tax=Streptomyces sp. NBC_00006 TaxID=2975619 RepID=UPI002257D44B|nr:alpha-L-rhamnosidase [Streptomyces sp. NBC_00006]MCX5535977.1 glycoside hydrolase family 78 protein [Streptomyces sp. NBC_00006]
MVAAPVTHLTVEYQPAALAIAVPCPRLSWVPGREQSAYEIEVRAAGELVAHTGRVPSRECHLVEVPDLRLRSDTDYEWRVRVWDTDGAVSSWASARFGSALLSADDWTASWVLPKARPTDIERWTLLDWVTGRRPQQEASERLVPVQLLRQRFDLDAPVARARLYLTARGIYTAELNGRRVGDEVLAPGFDSYTSRLCVQCYDVTDLLGRGDNILGVALADGWWAGRIGLTGSSAQFGATTGAIWQLHIETQDGQRHRITSDGDVVSAEGPWPYADLFIGERFDARLYDPAWSTPGFDDTTWNPVETEPADPGVLVPFAGEPVRRVDELPALSVAPDPDGGWIADFGQVVAGRVRITLRAPGEGDTVTLEHTETLDADGRWFENIEGINKEQRDTYVAAGRPAETYEPSFTFHGFRYLRVRGIQAPPHLDDLRAVVLSSDLPQTGSLHLSDERLDRLHRNVVWSQRANFLSVPTDCPQRERAGWAGDIQVFAPAAANNALVAPFLTRWLDNLRADQDSEGRIPILSPRSTYDDQLADTAEGFGSIKACAGWSDAIALVPWVLYERYGDRRVLADTLDAALHWIDHQRGSAAELPERLRDTALTPEQHTRQALLYNAGEHFGDWLTPSTLEGRPLHEAIGIAPKLTAELIAPMFQAQTLTVTARSAAALGRTALAARLRDEAAHVRAAFAAEYVDAEGRLPVALQGPYVLALAFDMVPAAQRPLLVDHLVHLITERGERLDTGFLSVPYLLDVLWDAGHADLARRLLWQDTCPSWLYEVDRGATTIWEAWDAITPDGTVRAVSFNHYAFGCVDDVLYRRIAGIRATAPGYRSAVLEPDLTGPLDHADAEVWTPYGPLRVDWTVTSGVAAIHTEIPHGVDAVLVAAGRSVQLAPGTHYLHISLPAQEHGKK